MRLAGAGSFDCCCSAFNKTTAVELLAVVFAVSNASLRKVCIHIHFVVLLVT